MTKFRTLHEAMVEVLRTSGRGWMARDEIAREIASRGLWRRPGDGRPPPSYQIRLRARNSKYQHLFEDSTLTAPRSSLHPPGS